MKATHRHISDNELFRRFQHFCFARIGVPVCKPIPPEVNSLIMELWVENIKQLDALEDQLHNQIHSDSPNK